MRGILLAGLILGFGHSAAWAACAPGAVDLRGDWGHARFNVEIADDNEERARGLMNRPKMAQSAGMLFVYDSPRSMSFWMRNTLIPLDMIFIDAQGVVQNIHHRAVPLDETPIHGGDNLLAALEINGGPLPTTARHGPAQNRAAWVFLPFSIGGVVVMHRPWFGVWRSLVAHLFWVQGVGGSNPLAPTIYFPRCFDKERHAQGAGRIWRVYSTVVPPAARII